VGGHRPIVWGGKSNGKKINDRKYIVAFGGHWLIILNTTINQKQTPTMGESMVRMCDRVVGIGKVQ
jgi:hypothetical protein